MTELTRNLLAAARDGMSPDAAAAARVRARVAAAVGAPVAVAATVVPAKTAGMSVALKLALLAGVIVVGAGSALLMWPSNPATAPNIAVATSEPPAPSAVTHTRSESASAATLAVEAPTASAAPPHESISLARENELVDLAMRALRTGDATVAVRATDTYEHEAHGGGQLAEEAAALAIEARCTLDEDVAARRARFDRTWPSSSQRRHIAAACDR